MTAPIARPADPAERIVHVAVEQAAYHFDLLYSYRFPAELGEVRRGCRVLVPFGGSNRRRQGIVVEIADTAAPEENAGELKSVLALSDPEPLLSDEMMNLALWLKEQTFCTVFDAVRAMLPTGLYLRIRSRLTAEPLTPAQRAKLTPEQQQLWQFVRRRPKGAEREVIEAAFPDGAEQVDALLAQGILHRCEQTEQAAGDAAVRMVRLVDPDSTELPARCTPRQKEVIALLRSAGCASVREIGYYTSATPSVIQTLTKNGVTELYEQEVLRSPYREAEASPDIVSAPLNPEQQAAFEGLLNDYYAIRKASEQPDSPDRRRAALLYGVTGSGKTRVYMNLIDRVLSDGRQALVLVPEISLTPQMVNLFVGKYGRRVAVLHSGLSIGERMDEWKRIKRGTASIVIGTRSAVFAPLDRLGLVVVDEEQEHTYKSEASPRYHARNVARYRCVRQGALLVLASATPSLETYFLAQNGRMRLYTLAHRVGDTALPEVTVADMREEAVPDTAIGETLREYIRQTLENGQQAILLLNRRGFNTQVSCRSCGEVFGCPSCSISLTYHRANRRMMCHYCGHSQPLPTVCPVCGSDKIRYVGLGTQRAEDELQELFPDARILRMDADATLSRRAYEEKFRAFGEGQYDLMIGTQMVAKGLDFPRVGLVGVLTADQMLYGSDYRCYETAFSLLTQVIGRAGRRGTPGRAVIQTCTPDNEVIRLAAAQDYPAFYDLELASRRLMKYPPYTDLVQFGLSSPQEQAVRAASARLLADLRELATGEFADLPMIVLDPTPAAVARIAGKYRGKLLIKTRNTPALRELIARLLTQVGSQREFRGVSVFADINPASIL